MNFKLAADEFLLFIETTRSKGTYKYNEQKVDILLDYFDDILIKYINKHKVLSFIRYLRQKNPDITGQTVNKYLSTLNRIIKEHTPYDVTENKIPESTKLINNLSDEVIHKIFSHYETHKTDHHETIRNYAFFSLLLDSGLRLSEALSLNVRDIDFRTNSIKVKQTKTKVERYVFFTNKTKLLLFDYIQTFNVTKKLFIQRNTKPLTTENIQKVVDRLTKRLNLSTRPSPHKWRHTFATNYVNRGGSLENLRILLGHTTLQMTQRYLHISNDQLKQEYFRINY